MGDKGDTDESLGGEVLQVFIRVRPQISRDINVEKAVSVPDNQSICVRSERHDVNCKYNIVFDETSKQADVFASVQPLLSSVLQGYNACIFAYGQTSAGKSHTMLGPGGGAESFMKGSKSEWGLIPRAVEYIFSELHQAADDGYLSYKVKASFVQVYNENLYDLLKDPKTMSTDEGTSSFGRGGDGGGLKIREVPKPYGKNNVQQYEVYISGLSEFRVQTESDVMQLLETGMKNRSTRSTDYNDTSSRSHAIFQLNFELEKISVSGRRVLIRAKLSFADLAGSEKMSSSEHISEAKHLKELTNINQSLSTLGNVIAALSSNKTHIPYRDSKLTRILQDSIGGNTRTIVIACVAPTLMHTVETVSTLQFADRAKSVMLRVRANTVTDDKELLIKAYAEIARLKMLLRQALRNGDKGSEGIRKSSDKFDIRNDGDESHRMNRSRSSGNSFNSVAQSDAAATYYASGKKTSGDRDNNSATLILFEDNEKLRTENKKMRQALEWSIKLARKKRSSSMDFDTAPIDEIETYRHILNSIDRTPVTAISPYVGSNHHNNNSSKKDKSQRDDVVRSTLTGLKTTPLHTGKTILRFTSPLLTKIASSDSMKKKVRGASISLPAVYKSQKELNYLEYIKSPNRTGKLPPRVPRLGGESPPLEPDSGRLVYRDGATSGVSRICKALSVDSRLDLNKRSENNSDSDEDNNTVRKSKSLNCPAHGGSLPVINLDTLKSANQSQGGSPLSSRTVDRSTGRGVDRYQDRNADSHYKNQYGSHDSVPKPLHDTMHMHRLQQGQGQEQEQGQFKVGFRTPKGYNSDDNATEGYADERDRGERERERGQHFLQHSDPRNLSLSVPRPEAF